MKYIVSIVRDFNYIIKNIMLKDADYILAFEENERQYIDINLYFNDVSKNIDMINSLIIIKLQNCMSEFW